VARTRERAKGRRGAEAEPFAKLPMSVMEHPALTTASHPAFRLLVIMVAGRTPQQNGRLMCTDAYAAKFGLRSHDTVQRARLELVGRGLIVCTRRGQKLNKHAALWAVTWLPIYSRDGQPVEPPEPASHAYRSWTPATPASGVINGADLSGHHPDQRGVAT